MIETSDSDFIFIFKLAGGKVIQQNINNNSPFYCIEGNFSVNDKKQIIGNITKKHSEIDTLENPYQHLLVFRPKKKEKEDEQHPNQYYRITDTGVMSIPTETLTISITEYTKDETETTIDRIPDAPVITLSSTNDPDNNVISKLNETLTIFNELFTTQKMSGGADMTNNYKNLQTNFKQTLTDFLMDPFILKLNSLSTNNITFTSDTGYKSDVKINLGKANGQVSHISITEFIKTVFAPFVYITLKAYNNKFISTLDRANNDIDAKNYSEIGKKTSSSIKQGGTSENIYTFHIYRLLKLFDVKYANPNDTINFQNSLFDVIKNVCDKMEDMKEKIEFIRNKNNTHVVKAIDANLAKQNNNNIIVMLKINNFDDEKTIHNQRFDVNIANDNKSMLLKYNDDNFPYYQDPPTTDNEKAGNVIMITSEYIKTFCSENYPTKRQDGGELTTFVDKNLIKKIKLENSASEYQFTINEENYDQQYLLGNYHEIYRPELENSKIAEKMNIIVDQLVEKQKPVFILGYGASGAGKTSSLIYFNKANENGILIHLCNILGANHEYSGLTVQTKEYFQVNKKEEDVPDKDKDNGICTGTDNGDKKKYTCTLADYQFTYGSNNWTRANNNNKSQTIHKYRPGSESMDQPTGQSLGETLIHIIDTDRFVKATTNNPNSSRSHVVVHLKFTNHNTKPAFLFVGDFAGVENKFTCNSVNTQRQFLNVENDEGNTYYGQKFHGGYDGLPRDTVFQSVSPNANTDSVLKDDKLFDWLNPIMTDTLKKVVGKDFTMDVRNLKYIIKNYFPIKLDKIDGNTYTFTYMYNEYISLQSMVDELKKIHDNESKPSSLQKRFSILSNHALPSIVQNNSMNSAKFEEAISILQWTKQLFPFNSRDTDTSSNSHYDDIRALIRDMYFDGENSFQLPVKRRRTDQNLENFDDYTVNNLFRNEVIDKLLNNEAPDINTYTFYIPNVRYNDNRPIVAIKKDKTISDETESNLTNEQKDYRHNTGFLKKTKAQVISDLVKHYYFMFARINEKNPGKFYLYNDSKSEIDVSNFFPTMSMSANKSYVSSCLAFFKGIANIHSETVARLDYAKEICNNRVVEGEFINDSLAKVRETIAYILSKKSENVIFNSPDFINECLTQYCKPGDFCFQVENGDKQSPNPVREQSEIFEDMYSFIHNDKNTPESKELFYKDIVVSIFGVLNISRKANNPPPVPYIDINELKRLYYSYKDTESNNILEELNKALTKVNEFSENETVVANWNKHIGELNDATTAIKNKISEKHATYEYNERSMSLDVETDQNHKYKIKEHYNLIKREIEKTYSTKNLFNSILEAITKMISTKKNNPIELLNELSTKIKEVNSPSLKQIPPKITLLIKYLTIHIITIPQLIKDIQHINSLITQAKRYLYDGQPANMNTQINVDMEIVNGLLTKIKDKDILTFKRGNDKGTKPLMELFIESVDTNNAISAVGTLEFLDKVSKFNVPNNLCKIDHSNGSNYKALYTKKVIVA